MFVRNQAPKPGSYQYGEWNADSPFDRVDAYKDTPIGCTWGINGSPAYPDGKDETIKKVIKVWGDKLGYSGSPGVIVCQCEVRKSTQMRTLRKSMSGPDPADIQLVMCHAGSTAKARA